jgi:hypothetical protein
VEAEGEAAEGAADLGEAGVAREAEDEVVVVDHDVYLLSCVFARTF